MIKHVHKYAVQSNSVQKIGIERKLSDTQQKITKLLLEDNQLSAIKLADKIGVAIRNIESNIKKLKE